jgi:endonuclease-3
VNVLNRIIAWRKDHIAPVDTVGCERLADPQAPAEIQKYQLLISLMLSIQTKD